MRRSNDYTVHAISCGLQVLQSFLVSDTSELSAKEISDLLGFDRSRVFRILFTLESQGFVRRDPHTKCYSLGLKLFELGQAVARRFDIAREAGPILAELTRRTGETSYVYVRDGLEAVTIAKRECTQPMRIAADLGHRDTLEVGAACNLLLAYLPPEMIDRVLGPGPLPRHTDRTLSDTRMLRERLVEIRRLGYHLSRGEAQEGVDAVAAPVRDSSGQVIAAMAIAGPSLRFTAEKTPDFIALVCNSAACLSAKIGCIPSNELLPRQPMADGALQ